MTPRPAAATGILSVWNEYPADDAEFYERWYMTEHFPERLGVPGFLRGRRYRAIDADRTYFTFYDLENTDVLFSAPYLARLDDPTAWTQRIMTRWSGTFRTVCQRLARSGAAVGGYAVVARFEGQSRLSRGQAADIRERLADPHVVAVDIWQATPQQNAESKESLARGKPDPTIAAAVVIEASSESAARKAKAALPSLLGPGNLPAAIGLYQLIALQDAPPLDR